LTTDVTYFYIANSLRINGAGVLNACDETRLVFDGPSSIGGTGVVKVGYVRVKSTGILTLVNDITVARKLEMDCGIINTGGHTLTLGTSAAEPGTFQLTGPLGKIAGTMKRWIGPGPIAMGDTAGLFPMGAGANFRKVWIAKSHTGAGTIAVTHTDGSNTTTMDPFDEGSGPSEITFGTRTDMSWTILAGDSYTGLTDLRIQESGFDPAIMPPTKLTVSLADAPAGGTYAASSVASGDTVAMRTDLDENQLSKTFYIASIPVAPLPVELTSFTGSAQGTVILLHWNTATEKNNYGFDVERSTGGVQNETSARIWSKVGFIEGHGTSNAPQAYAYSDHITGGSYTYRLKQIDRNGSFQYSKMIVASTGLQASEYDLGQNYPNPFNPSTTIRFAVNATQRAVVKVYNTMGQEVRTVFNDIAEANTAYALVFDARELPSGLYYYALQSGGRTDVKKMLLVK
jgi:hypothetical protein